MSLQDLTLDTVGDLFGGTARLIINRELQRLLADLADRGEEDEKSRKLTIELEFATKKGLTTVNVAAQAKLPPRRTDDTVGVLKLNAGQPRFRFQDEAPDNPDQNTFEYNHEKGGS